MTRAADSRQVRQVDWWPSFVAGLVTGWVLSLMGFVGWAMLIVSKRADEQAERWAKRRAHPDELELWVDELNDRGGHVRVIRPDDDDNSKGADA